MNKTPNPFAGDGRDFFFFSDPRSAPDKNNKELLGVSFKKSMGIYTI